MTTEIRETSAPWYIRQAEFDGVAIGMVDGAIPIPAHTATNWQDGKRFAVVMQSLPMPVCRDCGRRHPQRRYGSIGIISTDCLAEAEAAYEELERKLLAGELR